MPGPYPARAFVACALALAFTFIVGCDGCSGPVEGACMDNRDCPAEQICLSEVCTTLGGFDAGSTDAGSTDSGSADGGTDGGGNDGGLTEICGNGIDDTGDGLIDEGCSCTDGESQPCWPGSDTRRGVGICRDGAQSCVSFGDFFSWGACEGAVEPTAEIDGNGIDEDCNGSDGTVACDLSPENCSNNIDDDCDGLADCDDPDCSLQCPNCQTREILCGDGFDDDCDGLTDCDDPNCVEDALCQPPDTGCTPQFPWFVEIACSDGVDNDCDGTSDCGDSDCRQPGSCDCDTTETNCNDGLDQDCDGYTDCGDGDCDGCFPGQKRYCDEPTQCLWGEQECLSDSTWGSCYETPPPGTCSATLYDLNCCIAQGFCCENWPTDQRSVGSCATVSAGCDP